MSNILVEKNKLDILANAISNKSGEPLKLTLDEMVEAVDGIAPTLQAKAYTVDSAGTETITADSGYDGLSSVSVSVPSADPWLEIHSEYSGSVNNRVWTATPRVLVDVSEGDTAGFMADGYEKNGEDPLTLHAVPSGTTITPTTSSQTIGGTNYMMEGAVTVNPIPYADGDNEAYGHNEIWIINETPTLGGYSMTTYNIDFISNNATNNSINMMGGIAGGINYSSVGTVYQSNTRAWTNQAYRTIEITGGTDKDNANWMAWLEANAVKQ